VLGWGASRVSSSAAVIDHDRSVSEPTSDQLRAHLAYAEARAANAEWRVSVLEAELHRTRQWRQSVLIAVVVVALLAILMLGVVAFNAVDDQALSALGRA
jgi:cytochrome c-type biogenesis protein CcmH/NrfG